MSKQYPDVYFLSKFPGLATELRKFLPKDAKLIECSMSDNVKSWNDPIVMTKEDKELINNAEVLVMDSTYLSAHLYDLPHAKWVQSTWAGVDMLMSKYDKTKPLPNFIVTRFVDPYFRELMANYVVAQIVNIERGFYTYRDNQNECLWKRPFFPDFRVLSDLTLGILGSGSIGSAVGKFLKSCGCRVVAYVKNPRSLPSEDYSVATTSLIEVFEQCDYLCNVLPSTKDTVGLLDGDTLKMCRKKPVFINIGRGDVISEATVIKALDEGWISKAVLDVLSEEPLSKDSKLWKRKDVFITPHVGAIPRISGIAQYIAQNYLKYINGDTLQNIIEWDKGY